MKTCTNSIARLLCLLLIAAIPVRQVCALELPIRVSVNFILDASDNRPATGDLNTDAEVNDQVTRANEILAENGTEYKFQLLGINEVFGEEEFYNLPSGGNNGANRDAIRDAAIADPTTWHWRTDAINMYINGNDVGYSAISDFPPNNNIVLFNQYAYDPLMLHETGHSVNLYHTHSSTLPNGDGCTDTLPDNQNWTRDQIAQNSYALNYDDCSAAQKALVDNTWENLMSYHDVDNTHIITPQQNNRMSDQTYDDRNWLLTGTPVYIKDGATATGANGSWDNPYPTIQSAISAGQANNRTLVLMASGSHDDPASVIDTNTDLITRQGSSTIQGKERDYELGHNLENSTNTAVAVQVALAQRLTREGDDEGSLAAIRRAAELAKGKDRHALLIEIAARLKAKEEFDEAETFYAKAAAESDQPGLKNRFGKKAEKMKVLKARKLEREKERTAEAEEEQP
ncbi:hypothetical protein PDESU_02939 [Pontiella desulfatans]|uniref:Peptidase M43 pregnancy-associated plasma-A domain-containing protein n=1 Tax=Pontiella desulfatans TaxID=2750659 RepID=A0A6C2U2Z6_PONDE|nr:hypothetical protein [Pontiella desulfatans]VGO14378.1 hypothetical protein PDESU_02939 [Pontiella desulfatans]